MDGDPQYKTEDGAAVRIWADVSKNNFWSDKLGRAVFDECIFVEVITPGSKDSTPVFEVERTFCVESELPPKRRSQYETYKQFIENFKDNDAGGQGAMAGTPLKEWASISRTMAASLRESRIFTVEGLAALNDNMLGVIGPDGRTWREKAIAYLENAKDSAYATNLVVENERLKADLTAQGEQIAALSARLDAQDAANATAKPADAPATGKTAPSGSQAAPARLPADII